MHDSHIIIHIFIAVESQSDNNGTTLDNNADCITVATRQNSGKQNRDKKYCCLYCKMAVF